MKFTIYSLKGNYLALVCICALSLRLASCGGGGGGSSGSGAVSSESSSAGGVVISGTSYTVAELIALLPTLTADANYRISDATPANIALIKTALNSLKTNNSSVRVGLDFTPSTGLTELPGYTFEKCSNLSSVNLPSSVTTIKENAFANCSSLSSIIIPSSVTSIENHAFVFCISLTSVTFQGTAPPTTIGTDVFDISSPSLVIKVPSGAQTDYETKFPGITIEAL